MHLLRRNSWRGPIAVVLAGAASIAGRAAETGSETDAAIRRELRDRHALCAPNDAAARLELAEWAETRGLDGPAEALYREVVDLRPDNDEARAAVIRVADRRPLALESAPLDTARRQLGSGFALIETRRFVVLSDASVTWSREQAERLERAAHQFERFARRLDMRPLPLQHKLVCVLFADRERYRAFARLHDDVRDEWIAGYYAPRNDRIVFYHGETNPSVVQARSQLADMTDHVDELETAIRAAREERDMGRARQLVAERDRYRSHIRTELDRVDAFADQVVVATTLHECVHQLLFHMRVQSPYVQYPVWICEGLATAFETDMPNRAFGPDREYAPRRDRFDEILEAGGLIPLRELITMTELHSTADVDALYHQSYALVTWMSRFRDDELRRYLEIMRQEPSGRAEPDRLLAAFEGAFGSADELERAWLQHERGPRMVRGSDRP